MSRELSTFTIVWLCINYILIVPICAHFVFMFWQNRAVNIIHLRRPVLVQCINCYLLYFLTLHGPIYLILIDLFREHEHHLTWFVIDSVGYEIGFVFYLVRAWHVYYDVKYNRAQARRVWKKILNPAIDHKQNFFTQYRNTFGNFKYTFRIALLYIAFYVTGLWYAIFIYFFVLQNIFANKTFLQG